MPTYVLLLLLTVLWMAGTIVSQGQTDTPPRERSAGASASRTSPLPSVAASISRLKAEVQDLQGILDSFAERTPYIVIDTVHNRLQIRRRTRIIRSAICATGSGKILLGPTPDDTWHFGTPKGCFRVQRRVVDPIWKKPVWAFVEQNTPPPVLPWDFSRLDVTTLGKYALELGDGYEIHGTLYPSLLGRHITHGCIRLSDEDLEAAYTLTEVGSLVFIY